MAFNPSNVVNPSLWPVTSSNVNPANTGLNGKKAAGAGYNTLSYPENLGSVRYPYYMVFYVNVAEKSQLGKNSDNTSTLTSSNGVGNALQPSNIGSAAKANQGIQNVITQINTFAASLGVPINDITGLLSAGVSGALEFAKAPKRLNQVIALPIPNNVQVGSHAVYNAAASGIMGSLIKSFDHNSLGPDLAKKLGQSALTGAIDAVSGMLGGEKIGDNAEMVLDKLRNQITNQRKEQVFREIDTRSFTFDWLFVPRSQTESDTITEIVQWLKYHQHPEILGSGAKGTTAATDMSGINMLMPNEFDINFESQQMLGNPNITDNIITSLPRISTCVLTAINVNYTPLNKFIAFNDVDDNPTGNPVAVHMQLSFMELEPLTRTQILQGC
jgi:hypothetical protein